MKMKRLCTANVKMIFRNRLALFWALIFPLLFVALFGLFSGSVSNTLGKLAYVDNLNNDAPAQLRQAVIDSGIFDVVDKGWREDEAKKALRNGDVSFVLMVEAPDAAAQAGLAQTPDFTLYTDGKNQKGTSAA